MDQLTGGCHGTAHQTTTVSNGHGSTRGIEIPLACKPKLPGTRGSFSPDEAKPHPIVGSLRDAARVAVAVGRTPKGSFDGM